MGCQGCGHSEIKSKGPREGSTSSRGGVVVGWVLHVRRSHSCGNGVGEHLRQKEKCRRCVAGRTASGTWERAGEGWG